MNMFYKTLLSSILIISGISSASAGVVIGGTRVVYDGAKKEASLSVSNPDSVPYLIQSWLDNPDGSQGNVPFIITPPLYRLDHSEQNVMRIVRAGNISEDKETMYWLNVKAIPSSEKKENSLQIAIKTRIKLIYRPAALHDHSPEEFADKLSWVKIGNKIKVTNPSAYYMNFNEVTVGNKKIPNVTYVAPGQSAEFNMAGSDGGQVNFKIINDYGGTGKTHKAAV